MVLMWYYANLMLRLLIALSSSTGPDSLSLMLLSLAFAHTLSAVPTQAEGALVSKYFVCIIVRTHVQHEKVFALPKAAPSPLRLTFWLAGSRVSHLLWMEGVRCDVRGEGFNVCLFRTGASKTITFA